MVSNFPTGFDSNAKHYRRFSLISQHFYPVFIALVGRALSKISSHFVLNFSFFIIITFHSPRTKEFSAARRKFSFWMNYEPVEWWPRPAFSHSSFLGGWWLLCGFISYAFRWGRQLKCEWTLLMCNAICGAWKIKWTGQFERQPFCSACRNAWCWCISAFVSVSASVSIICMYAY